MMIVLVNLPVKSVHPLTMGVPVKMMNVHLYCKVKLNYTVTFVKA